MWQKQQPERIGYWESLKVSQASKPAGCRRAADLEIGDTDSPECFRGCATMVALHHLQSRSVKVNQSDYRVQRTRSNQKPLCDFASLRLCVSARFRATKKQTKSDQIQVNPTKSNRF
jgi:hypothetical protein